MPLKRTNDRPPADNANPVNEPAFHLSDKPRDQLRVATTNRLFVREAGWKAQIKEGSDRLFCYAIAPDESVYHRIADGEVYFQRGDERICVPCADRLGLLHHGPKLLRDPSPAMKLANAVMYGEYSMAEDDPSAQN